MLHKRSLHKTYFEASKLGLQVDPVSEIDWDQNVCDDENGDYIITSGELVDERYIIKEQIGKVSSNSILLTLVKLV